MQRRDVRLPCLTDRFTYDEMVIEAVRRTSRFSKEKVMHIKQRIVPCLWFDHQAEEAAKFYVSVFKNSKITTVSRYSSAGQEIHGRPPGSVMVVAFELDGQAFTALNGGPAFTFNEAVSLQLYCDTQKEIDEYLGEVVERRRSEGAAVRLAERQVRPLVAGRSRLTGRDGERSRIAAGAAGHDGPAPNEETRHRRAGARGCARAVARISVKPVQQCFGAAVRDRSTAARRAAPWHCGRYSCRNATSGSTRLARRAGK